MRILVIEGEPALRDYLKQGLEGNGYAVDVARDGAEGRLLAAEGRHALVLLDVMSPGADGFAVLQAIRRSSSLPVLVLTARDRVAHRVSGLRLGADDYLVKPFSFSELLARVQALLRRGKRPASNLLRLADLELDLASRSCARGQADIELTAKEFALLAVLLRHRGEVLSRAALSAQVWEDKLGSDTNVIEVAIRRLRAKIDEPFPVKLLHTVRGQGYVLEDRS
ncbi:two-component system copper resistance phosphate regulon response regulator CusR [Variovorax sp. TBS-050B]|uniref:winged helix-turn-helix domain-containing protein n=1 Tax=Variovorax sp. TBS-050B TaxID=2940551 RepID=UPI00247692F3|nr:winged helix-turn-helix domain-containing protein [Variovorax sp. TBS-050B]MDH6593676.1 two-component system copper resistance phosphate regulon response regulator CusR [Variovorax sp. TBS-050B]